VISAAENSNRFQITRFWKEKSVEDVVTLGPTAQATLVIISFHKPHVHILKAHLSPTLFRECYKHPIHYLSQEINIQLQLSWRSISIWTLDVIRDKHTSPTSSCIYKSEFTMQKIVHDRIPTIWNIFLCCHLGVTIADHQPQIHMTEIITVRRKIVHTRCSQKLCTEVYICILHMQNRIFLICGCLSFTCLTHQWQILPSMSLIGITPQKKWYPSGDLCYNAGANDLSLNRRFVTKSHEVQIWV
jgi:hypothetical protein